MCVYICACMYVSNVLQIHTLGRVSKEQSHVPPSFYIIALLSARPRLKVLVTVGLHLFISNTCAAEQFCARTHTDILF